MFKDMFRKTKYVTIQSSTAAQRRTQETPAPTVQRKELPDGLWVKCPSCGEVLFNKDL